MKETFYITTPIYFPSDKLHIGHSYSTVAADTMARYKKLRGFDVKFLTGTDEHGQKIEQIAKDLGVSPKDYVDKIVAWIKDLWAVLDIDYDIFLRTTDKAHEDCVQKIFKTLYDKGDIYKGHYEGFYCVPCETFFTPLQLVDGNCPDCGRSVEKIKEESYFFKLSKYQDRLIEYIEANPNFIEPAARQNEMLNNFLRPGLEDLSVSRTSFDWGIPIGFDPKHIVYVWIDALSNYITALGYLSEDDSMFKKYWPADVHLVGKEIVRFHTIIWPAMLMALDIPLPKQIFGHGWLTIDGGKISKSKGNVVDPSVLVERYGVDAVRYFLMREVAFGQDGNYTNKALIGRINSDLANDFGNLLSRTVGMIDKYFGDELPTSQTQNPLDSELMAMAETVVSKVEIAMDQMHFSDALTEIWTFIRRLNKYIDETEPWVLAKDENKKAELANILYMLSEGLRVVSVLVSPFMPQTPKTIHQQLCITDDSLKTWGSAKQFGLLARNVKICKGQIVFPRIDIEKELAELEEATKQTQQESVANRGKETEETPITIDDFAKVKLKVGQIIECEKVEGSDKLLKSQIKIGGRMHQIVSGIAKHYSPEQLVGKKVAVVANLKPVKLRGVLSEGMILAAEDEQGVLNLLTVDGTVADGAGIS